MVLHRLVLGVFGSPELVNMGIGVERLGVFNNLTITSLLDIDAIGTVGSACVDTSYLAGFGILAAAACIFYAAGALVFAKKDLPL